MPNLGIFIGNGLIRKMDCKVVKCAMKGKKLLCLWSICMICLALGSCMPDIEELNEGTVNGEPGSRSYVDLGLSVKWANCNVGAEHPWEYGGYYCWGETYEKSSYYIDDYKCYYETEYSEYGYDYEFLFYDISGSSNDVAYYQWGYSWRMPTLDEIQELMNDCSWRWTYVRGVGGYMVTGPNGNSIFLPAAGDASGSDYEEQGSSGYYWCGRLAEDEGDADGHDAYLIGFFYGDGTFLYYGDRSFGFSVRPVYKY